MSRSLPLKDTPAPWLKQLSTLMATNAASDITGSGSHSFLFRGRGGGGLFLRWRLGEQSVSQCCSCELMICFFFSLEMACQDDPCLCSDTAFVIDVFRLSCCNRNIDVHTGIHIRHILYAGFS